MQKRFSYQFSSQIWRILPHMNPLRNEWVVELRDAESKNVALAAIDPVKGALIWQTIGSEIDWWSTLVMVDEDQIYIHCYRYPEIPEATDLQVFSLLNGKLLNTIPNHFLVGMPENGKPMVARRVGESLQYFCLDSNTGALTPFTNTNEEWIGTNYKLPVLQKQDDPHFEAMHDFINSVMEVGPIHSIEYLDFKPYMMFSYYIYQQDGMDQYILIVNKNREIVLHDLIIKNVNTTGLSTMILKEDVLVYLKNKNEFSSLKFL